MLLFLRPSAFTDRAAEERRELLGREREGADMYQEFVSQEMNQSVVDYASEYMFLSIKVK